MRQDDYISVSCNAARRPTACPQSGFVLPAVVLLMLVMLLVGLGRLAAYRFQLERSIDLKRQTGNQLAVNSGIAWLRMNLYLDPQWTGSVTNWIVLTNDLAFAVAGDGHRFEARARRAETEVLHADLIVPDTTNTLHVVVRGLINPGM